MGKLGPKLELSFLNSIQICRPKDMSSLVITPLPPPSYDILFPSFEDPPSHTKPPRTNAAPSHHFSSRKEDHYAKNMTKEPKLKAKREKEEVRAPRFKRFGSKENEMVGRKVDESFVVTKRSVDPCQDFKKSMLEMIVEKHIFEPKELEHLLMTFLSMNSTTHHRAIFKAFTQIYMERHQVFSN